MKVVISFRESIYDCKLRIEDSAGCREYSALVTQEPKGATPYITAEVYSEDFDLTLIPVMADTKAVMEELEGNRLRDKVAKKVAGFVFSTLDKMILRVGCKYRVTGFQEGDRLDVSLQSYLFGPFDRYNIFDLIPAMYLFFEVSNFNSRYKLLNAFETNRRTVLKSAKALAFSEVLGNGFIFALITYPFQMGRIKYLTSKKKVQKALIKFNNFSPEEREKFLKRQEKLFDS